MKKHLYAILIVLTAVMLVCAKPGHAKADVNDFVITNFSGEYNLTNQDPQGKLNIKETIDVHFNDYNHGILRAIPTSYKGHSVQLNDIKVTQTSGNKWQFTTYKQNDNLVLKIGDPNHLITGDQEFIVQYSVQNVITFYQDHDELYWDINGDQWQQIFDKVKAVFHFNPGYVNDPSPAACYTGAYGTNQSRCDIKTSAGMIVAETNVPLNSNQTLTSVIKIKKGIFKPPTFVDNFKDNWKLYIFGFGIPFAVFVIFFWRWFFRGRDPKGRGTIVPEYDSPDGLRPAMVGTLVDFKVDNRDISATIIDLAVRKYIRIIETDKKKLIGSKKEYSLELLNNDFSNLEPYESQLIKGIFTQQLVGENVTIASLKNKFYKTVETVRTEINDKLKTDGYFANDPTKILGKASLIFFIALGSFYVVRNGFIILEIFVCVIIIYFFEKAMAKRTAKGVAAKEQILGLKQYMQTAEADRLKMLQSPDAPYAEKSSEPVKTVKLFEKLLPFAVALAVEKDWAKQFQDIYKQPPDWYSGNWNNFNAIYFASAISNSVNAMGTNFSPPSSSNSSGFGGGGFSGGGGGGGGGGGW